VTQPNLNRPAVRKLLARIAPRMAPRALANLRTISSLDQQFDQGPARFIVYERELRALRREIDELRRDNRRVAELYDAVFERAKQDAAASSTAGSGEATVERVGSELRSEVADQPAAE
jgi:hypothetical protein